MTHWLRCRVHLPRPTVRLLQIPGLDELRIQQIRYVAVMILKFLLGAFLASCSLYYALAVYLHRLPPIQDTRPPDTHSNQNTYPAHDRGHHHAYDIVHEEHRTRFRHVKKEPLGVWIWEPWRLIRDKGMYNDHKHMGILEVLRVVETSSKRRPWSEEEGPERVDIFYLRYLEGSTFASAYDLFPEFRPPYPTYTPPPPPPASEPLPPLPLPLS